MSQYNLKISMDIVIGVTGHRNLPNKEFIHGSINEVIKRLENRFSKALDRTKYSFKVISPLAEGTDRIAAEEVLKLQKSSKYERTSLEVILPLSEEEYINDFNGHESKEEFKNLLKKASSIKFLNGSKCREDAYYNTGIYVVDNCDILIAVWNGKPAAGKGGTADIVKYARDRKKWIFWINSENGIISETGNDEKLFKYLNIYNKESINDHLLKGSLKELNTDFKDKASRYNLSNKYIDKLSGKLLPQFIKADILAQKYQKRYRAVGTSIYALSAGAVATITIQILFFPNLPQLIWAEFIEIFIILFLLLISSRQDWHRKWIDYRFLAERLRIALFFRIANIKCEISTPPPHLRLTDSSEDWIVRAFNSIWGKNELNIDKIPFEGFKKFLLDQWIDNQIIYYQKASKRNKESNMIFTRLGTIFFILTLVAASIHALNIEIFNNMQILIATAIILPTVAAALTGIKNSHEYGRNAKRYNQMSQYISHIKERIEQAEDMETLVEILDKANQIMLGEHQDWRVVVQFHKLQPP